MNRGYTGHEHLDAFGIINMNGRVYDPLTAEFFSPDPVLTDAGNWLDYNRYGYCLNNPFRYTDPSGYTWWAENGNMVISTTASIIISGVVAVATAGTGVPAMIASGIAAGAAGGFTGGAVSTGLAGGSFNDAMKAGLQGAAMGALMGGITAGIGAAFGPAGSMAANAVNKFNVCNELGRAGVHALAQGGFSVMRGGDFWQGAAAGFVSSIAGSAAQGIGIHGLGMVGVTAASGGIGAAIAGGKAEDILFGIVQGAMVGMLNHFQTEVQEKRQWEQKQVERIYNLLTTKDNLAYADVINEIGTKYEQTLNLSGMVNIQGEKVRLCMTIDISKNHLDKNLQWYREVAHNYGEIGVAHDTYSQTVLRQGRWNIDYYSVWRPNIQVANPLQPFIVSYPQKFQSIINFK